MFWRERTQRTLQCELEPRALSHARETFARVSGCEVRCTLHTTHRFSFPVSETPRKKKNAQYSCRSLDDHQEDDSEEGHRAADEEKEGEFDYVCQFHCHSAR